MSILHVAFYPSDWLAGTRGLSDAETGVYITLFCLCAETDDTHNLIYLRNSELAKACGTTKKRLRSALNELDRLGLIFGHCGGLGVVAVSEFQEKYRQGKTRRAIPLSVREHVYDRDAATCQYCGEVDGEMHIDHIYPVCRGGSDEPENLTIACAPCNLSKGGKTLDEWKGRDHE
jgi:hypothetical protein